MYHSTNKGEMPWAGEMPILVRINGVPMWRDVTSGRTFPQVAGAEDPPPADTDNADKDADPSADEKWDEDRAKKAFAALREKEREREKASRAQAKETADLKARLAQYEREKLSETERLAAEKADLEKEVAEHKATLREMRTVHAIEQAATTQGARKPGIVARLIDKSTIQYDSDGNPLNAEELVKDLLKAEPYLVGTGGGGSSGVPASPRSNGTLTRDDEVKKNKQELEASPHYQPLG